MYNFYVEKVKNANFLTLSIVNTDKFSTETFFSDKYAAQYINFILGSKLLTFDLAIHLPRVKT